MLRFWEKGPFLLHFGCLEQTGVHMGWVSHPLGKAPHEMGWGRAPAFLDRSHRPVAGLFLSLSALQLILFAPDLAKKPPNLSPDPPDPWRGKHLLSHGGSGDWHFWGGDWHFWG